MIGHCIVSKSHNQSYNDKLKDLHRSILELKIMGIVADIKKTGIVSDMFFYFTCLKNNPDQFLVNGYIGSIVKKGTVIYLNF